MKTKEDEEIIRHVPDFYESHLFMPVAVNMGSVKLPHTTVVKSTTDRVVVTYLFATKDTRGIKRAQDKQKTCRVDNGEILTSDIFPINTKRGHSA